MPYPSRFKRVLIARPTRVAILVVVAAGILVGVGNHYYPYLAAFKVASESVISRAVPASQTLKESQIVSVQLPYNCQDSVRDSLVYLPPGYDADDTSVRYPSLYLLHGSSGDQTDWMVKGNARAILDEMIRQKNIVPMIVVLVDTSCGTDADVQYVDTVDGAELNETYISNYLTGYIDAHFQTRLDHRYRAIGGLSSGGFGALNISLKHQHAFGKAIDLSGYGTLDQTEGIEKLIQLSHGFVDANSPSSYIKKLKEHETSFWVAVGQTDYLLPENKKLHEMLKTQGFASTLSVEPGAHEWNFWQKELRESLVWLSDDWKAKPGT